MHHLGNNLARLVWRAGAQIKCRLVIDLYVPISVLALASMAAATLLLLTRRATRLEMVKAGILREKAHRLARARHLLAELAGGEMSCQLGWRREVAKIMQTADIARGHAKMGWK